MSDGAPEIEPLPRFPHPAHDAARAAELLRPPSRVSVSEAAARHRMLHNPGGGYSGPWLNETAPELVEPMDMVTSRRVQGVVFVGPSQSGKTDALILNPIVHGVMVDPADTMVVQMSESQAKDFSRRRVDRMNRHSRDLARRLMPGPASEAVYTKRYGGMTVTMGWPTVNQLSSRPIPRMLLTDVDRMPEDVEGEGSPFALALARITTFGSRGYMVAESSPGYPIQNPRWKPAKPHEAPPTKGILALYNQTDRRRRYWPCPHCGGWFEGEFDHLQWQLSDSITEMAESTVMICPINGCVIEPKHRPGMRAAGQWVPEGQRVADDCTLEGEPTRAGLAGYWLKGVSAAFLTWPKLVAEVLAARREYDQTGSEQTLKTVTNTRLGLAYLPKAAEAHGTLEADDLEARAEPYALAHVPEGGRFVTVTVDVQAGRFEVGALAWGVGLETWVIDRFKIFKSADGERPLDPAKRGEDWHALFDLLDRRYPLAEDPARGMLPAVLVIDSHGEPGVTPNAYKFWREAKRRGLHKRVALTRGTGSPRAARVAKSFPESGRSDRNAEGRGEVPVYTFQANTLKDEMAARLGREDPGPFYMHFSQDLRDPAGPPHPFFEEMVAEERAPDGTWSKVQTRNESWDLCVMAHVGAIAVGAEKINWRAPPAWAAAPADNVLVASMDAPARQATPAAAPTRRRRVLSKGIR